MKKVKRFFSMKNVMLVTAIVGCVVLVSIVPTQANFPSGTDINADTYTLGKVGIGTQTPSAKLHISDTINNQTELQFTSNSKSWAIGSAGSAWGSLSKLFYVRDLTVDWPSNVKFVINPTGNVGIGTPSPIEKLHISDTISNQTVLRISSNSQSWAIGSAGSAWGGVV